jgi:hypothetical protein
MNAKAIYSSALVLAVLAIRAARAEDFPAPMRYGGDPPPAATPVETPEHVAAPASLSSWITYQRPECCGPIGGHGPIGIELYIRTGPSLPVEGAYFGHTLETGWEIGGGGRSLFFDADLRAAWTVDLGLCHIYNHGQRSDLVAPLSLLNTQQNPTTPIIPTPVTVRSLNRTYVSIALGREWYLYGSPGECSGWKWRAGIDVGGRLGSARIDLDQNQERSFLRRNDIISGTVLGIYTDAEWSCGCCTFLAGVRAEWAYTFIDHLLQLNDTNVQDVDILLNLGVKF